MTLSLLIALATIDACTGLKLRAQDGSTVHGRTLEFGVAVETSIAFIPKGYQFIAETPEGGGMKYASKYATVGAMCYDTLALMDGLNEEGLAVGTFYFPGYAEYTPTTKENIARSLSPIDFSNWILTQFRTVEEVRNGLSDVVMASTVYKNWGNTPPPFHYIVYEKVEKA